MQQLLFDFETQHGTNWESFCEVYDKGIRDGESFKTLFEALEKYNKVIYLVPFDIHVNRMIHFSRAYLKWKKFNQWLCKFKATPSYDFNTNFDYVELGNAAELPWDTFHNLKYKTSKMFVWSHMLNNHTQWFLQVWEDYSDGWAHVR